MGYYTRFELDIISGDDNKTDYLAEIGEMSGYGSIVDDLIKWYDYHKDMLVYSLQHPDTVFQLCGEGEEAGDLWKCYYKNGKYQHCQGRIVYDELDMSLLN